MHISLSTVAPAVFCCILAAGVGLGFICGGLELEGHEWLTLNKSVVKKNRVGAYYTLSKRAVVGVFLVLFAVAVGPRLAESAFLTISRIRGPHEGTIAGLQLLLTSGIFVALICAGVFLVQAKSEYFWYHGSIPLIHTLKVFLGGLIIASYAPVCIGGFFVFHEFIRKFFGIKRTKHVVAGTLQRNTFLRANLYPVLGLLILLAVVFFCTLFLPHMWNTKNTYYTQDSTSSMIHHVKLYEGKVTHYVLSSSKKWVADTTWFKPVIYVKLYQDVVVYFAIVVGVVILGVTGTYHPPLRKLLHRRFSMSYIPKIMNLWPTGASAGELLLFSVYLGLNAYWFWFWSTGFLYRKTTKLNLDPHPKLQLYARVTGQMATLSMSFLILPVARNSVWESVFGVPFDRAIRYHRTLGVIAWTWATLHMWLWQIKFIKDGTLAHNCWKPEGLTKLIISGTLDVPIETRSDNWTTPIMEITWLLCTISLSIAIFVRTYNYELFKYTHYLMMLFFITGFLHAFSFWYYTAFGLILFALDKAIQMVNNARVHVVKGLESVPSAGVTRLTLKGDVFRNPHVAGQYVWLTIPALDPFQSHPFTISSAPSDSYGPDGYVHFTIKDVGEGTWTGRLAALARSRESADKEVEPLYVSVDGPYGRAIRYSEYEDVVLVAGGIGITPMASILFEILSKVTTTEPSPVGSIKRIHLIWSVRSRELLNIFANPLREKMRGISPSSVQILLHFHVTESALVAPLEQRNSDSSVDIIISNDLMYVGPGAEEGKDPEQGSVEKHRQVEIMNDVKCGRPALDTLFKAIAESAGKTSSSPLSSSFQFTTNPTVACLVCGPVSMTEEVSTLSFKYNFCFQAEEFRF